ncbi:MAG: alpha-amylase family glycosyl hydrolase, partial [Desulfobulbaceae bacterium]|nr:alpha-amylase family glycosyl hydrolase [Desulfobulbaceae bacterium]
MPQGINFALFSRHATGVSLVVSWRKPGQEAGLLLTEEIHLHDRLNKTGDVWHVLLEGAYEDLRYGYRVRGPAGVLQGGLYYNENLVLLDPYAKALAPFSWGEREKVLATGPRCLVDDGGYDWEGDKPLNTPLKDSVIYELHVRGFTHHASSEVQQGGFFGGIVEKIDYLKELGVTAVELMPVTEFDENDNIFKNPLTGEQLRNYWGYSPLSFFAPKSAYAKRGKNVL